MTELMVVIAIVSILSAISIPNLIRWRQDNQLDSAARRVQSVIQAIRMRALKEVSFTEIVFDADAGEYETHIGGRVLKYHLPDGIRMQNITFNDDKLRFNSRGLPAGGVGSVTFTNQLGVTVRIVVPFTGNPRITM